MGGISGGVIWPNEDVFQALVFAIRHKSLWFLKISVLRMRELSNCLIKSQR